MCTSVFTRTWFLSTLEKKIVKSDSNCAFYRFISPFQGVCCIPSFNKRRLLNKCSQLYAGLSSHINLILPFLRVRTITIRFFEAQWCRNMTVNSKSLKFSRLRYTPYCCFQYLAFSIYFFLSTSLPFPNLYQAIFHSQPIVNAKTEGTAEMPPITQI